MDDKPQPAVPARLRAFYIVGSHWDREWYEPFQEYRMWLVQMLDAALDHLASHPEYGVFHLDGQAVMLEDYLQLRPERESELRAFLGAGRLVAGPWYCMPDLWLVSGEALIRNFNRGMVAIRRLGAEPATVAYTPDLFGHIASMPMIYRGLGLHYCVVWRGLNDADVPGVFQWVAPDGSRVLTHHLPDNAGYGWFGALVRWPWMAAGRAPEVLSGKLHATLREQEERNPGIPIVYLSDAGDHQSMPVEATELLETARKLCPEVEFHQSSMEDYFRSVEEVAPELPEWHGELRKAARRTGNLYHALIPHCQSSRYPIKLANDRCQNLLTRWAEPLAAIAAMEQQPLAPGYLRMAWDYLLLNQPHDSVCGCSVDETHADMTYRFHQAELLADGVRRQSFARCLPTSAEPSDVKNLAVWNPLPWERHGIQEIEVLFPADFPAKAMRSGHNLPLVNQFRIVDSGGHNLPYQLLEANFARNVKRPDKTGKRTRIPEPMDVYRLAVDMRIPSFGYTGLTVKPLDGIGAIERSAGTLRTGHLSAENEFLGLRVEDSGRVWLKDKSTGREFPVLFCYEDSGDTGDGWNFVPPLRNQVVKGPGHTVTTSIEEDGPLIVTFRIERYLRVPAGLEPLTRECRSPHMVDLKIVDYLSLYKGEGFLRVRTVVHNNAGDHRLRVLHPSGLKADTYSADQPFAWVERPVATDPDSWQHKEPDPEERPHHTALAIAEATGGLALLTPCGLHEHAVMDDADRTLALTLFRAVQKTHGTDGESGGQTLHEMEFTYVMMPFAGSVPRGTINRIVTEQQTGVAVHQVTSPVESRSWLSMESDIAVSVTAIKPSNDARSIIIRLWNTSANDAATILTPDETFGKVEVCDLREQPNGEVPVRNGKISVEVPAYGLSTIKIQTS